MANDYVGHRESVNLVVDGRGKRQPSAARFGDSDHIATPLPVAVTAAGLVSAVRFGPDAVDRRGPQVAQWDAIRSHYQEVADWIDNDAAGGPLPWRRQTSLAGRMSRAGIVDYLGLLDCGSTTHSSTTLSGGCRAGPTTGSRPDASVDAASTELAEFRRDYELAAIIGPLHVYRRCAAADTV